VARASQWRRSAWSEYKRPRFKGDDGYRAVDTFAREPFHAHSFFRMGAGSVYRGFAGGGWSAGGLNDWRGVERLTYRVVREATDQSGWWLIDAQTNQGLTPEDYRWDWHGIEQVRWGPPGRMYEFGNLSRVRAFEPLDVLCERLVGGSPGYRLLAFAPDHPFDWVPPLSPSHRIAARWADEPVVVPAGRFGRCWESAYYHKYKGCTWSEKAYLAKGVGLVKREQSVQYGNKEAVVTTLWELESYQVKEE
jgi:hypothetical protein